MQEHSKVLEEEVKERLRIIPIRSHLRVEFC